MEVDPVVFLTEPFRDKYLRQGTFTALSLERTLDTEDVIALVPPGILLLNLTLDTYQRLGLVGKSSQIHGQKGKRFQVPSPSALTHG